MLRQVSATFRRSTLLVQSRRLLADKKYPSILGESNVQSPFADPSRNRTVSSSTTSLLSGTKSPVFESSKTAAAMKESMIHSSAVVAESKVPDVPPKIKEIPKPIVELDKEENQEKRKMTAIEELTALKESVQHLKSSEAAAAPGGASASDAPAQDDDHAEEAEKRRQKMARNTKIGMFVVFGGAVAGFVGFCLYYGSASRDESGHAIEDEFTSAGFFAPFYRIANSIKLWKDYVVEPAREKLLPDPMRPPYIQPKYTLVIEMKNVLVAPEWTYKTGYRFVKRPALEYFLDIIGYPNFEVVIYSSESNFTGPAVVESIDPKQRIMFKLFRDCTKYHNGHHLKDLSKLNRDLSKVIFIDFDPNSFQLNPENVLRVPKWEGDMADTSLVDLAELLKTIHLSDVEDVRPTLQYYSQYDDPAKEFRRRAIYLAQQEEEKKHTGQEQSILKRYSGRLFGFQRHASA